MKTENKNNEKQRNIRGLFGKAAAMIFFLAILAVPSFAQSAAYTGRVVHTSNQSQFATVEIFTTSSNAFGYWGRMWMQGNKVRTVMPASTNENGTVNCQYIEYSYYAGEPLNTKYWQETYSGWIVLGESGGVISGAMINTLQKIGEKRVEVRDNWLYFQIIF